MATLPTQILAYRGPIDAMLSRIIDEAFHDVPALSTAAHQGRQLLEDYIARPGKRIRGALVASLYDDFMGTELDEVGLRAAAALEIIQAHLLMIDDVMDKSSTRRGQPALHYVYQDTAQVSLREAEMATILFADIAYAIANHAISCLEAPPQYVTRALGWLQADIMTTNIGQFDDMSQSLGHQPTLEDIMRRYQQKTSYYSFVNPLTLGLTLAGKEKEGRAAAEAFGIPAGVAFQLGDDLLGVFGDPGQTGKSNLDDLREGKYTLLMHFAYLAADETARTTLRRLLGKTDADEADLREMQQVLEVTGAVARARQERRQAADQAIASAINSTVWSKKYGNLLRGLVEFSIERSV